VGEGRVGAKRGINEIFLVDIPTRHYNYSMNKLLGIVLYDLTLSLWVGGMAIFTFIVTPAIFRSFDRDMAGRIVGALFNGYFLYNLVLAVVALALAFIVWPDRAQTAYKVSLLLIACAITVNIYIAFKLHPDIVEVKRQVASFETTPKDSPLRKQFTRMHAVSAIMNLFLLADGVTLVVIRASRLNK
jgi:uncharacterized membrane protein